MVREGQYSATITQECEGLGPERKTHSAQVYFGSPPYSFERSRSPYSSNLVIAQKAVLALAFGRDGSGDLQERTAGV